MWKQRTSAQPLDNGFLESDLEDPELLKELNQLLKEQAPHTRRVPTAAVAAVVLEEVNVEQVLAELPPDDVQIEFNDNDMQDPELLVNCASCVTLL